jgi:hypothetical protein
MNRKVERGSALATLLILTVGVSAAVTTFLGRTLVEQARVSQRAAQVRDYRQALGQLELAKAVVNQSSFTNGSNDAVQAALAANPPVIPGTGVLVESAGPPRWYRLTSFGDFSHQTSAVYAYMRDGTPYVAYNYYVEDDALGVSGKPRGRIHANKEIEFYYANGFYDDYVSAGEGFVYKNGATPDNTMLAGGSDPGAAEKSLLDFVDYGILKSQAKVVTDPLLEAVVALQDKNVRIDLFTKPSVVQVPVTKFKNVLTGWTQVLVTVTNYVKQWQWVPVQVAHKVWVQVDTTGASGGTDLGGGSNAGGYWKTVYDTVQVFKLVNVPNGTSQVLQWKPVYTAVPYTAYVNQTIPGVLQSSDTYAANGNVFYFSDNVNSLSGNLNGRCTLVSEHNVLITGNVRYHDDNGEYAYLNGLDNTLPYDPNPKFTRNHSLGVIAIGDIRYARSCPDKLEINGSLISTNGVVGMEGIVVSTVAGKIDESSHLSLSGSAVVKTSLRRFGSIMSSKRPVSTLLDNANLVQHGFRTGSSTYDRNNLLNPPPGYPNEEVVMWVPSIRADGPFFTAPGAGSFDSALVTPIGQLTPFPTLRDRVRTSGFRWNPDVSVGSGCGG